MKHGKYISQLLLLFIAIGRIPVFAQDNIQNNVCICASYSSLRFLDDYENFFPHEKIKSEKIKQVIVYTDGHSSTDTTKQLLHEKYVEMKLNFDDRGFVSARIEHYNGLANYIIEFERNEKGQVTQTIESAIDSLEQKLTFFPPTIVDYTYDNMNRLVKMKTRDSKGNIIPDEKASFTEYKYDKNGHVIKVASHLYFDFAKPKESENSTTNKYSRDSLTCISESINNGQLFLMDTTEFDAKGNVISKKSYNHLQKAEAFDTKYNYDANGKLVYYESKTGSGGGSECPDNGTFTDYYFYKNNGLVERITSSYESITCEMKFEYLK